MSYTLKNMDLSELKTPEEQIAFWVNMYNVIVIHGVVELGIRDSVKEVRNIFKRIQYRIGDNFFSPDDIEHGILRSNRRPPNSLFRVLKKNDTRLRFSVQDMDPRIHFALVCASSSCPPIAFYSSEKIDEELTIAEGTFLNGGGIQLDRQRNRMILSRIFKWYAADFGDSNAEILKFIAHCIINDDDKNHILANTENIKIEYQDYDWRLNRY